MVFCRSVRNFIFIGGFLGSFAACDRPSDVIDLDARALVSSLDAISRAELRAALSDKNLLAENRAARNSEIADLACCHYAEFSPTSAAKRLAADLASYARGEWKKDFLRLKTAPQAGERRRRFFLIMRLSGGRPTGVRTIQEILVPHKMFFKKRCAKHPIDSAH